MEQKNLDTYCLFCLSGQEGKVIDKLTRDGYVPLAPQVVRWKPGKNGVHKSACRLLPGYVFFDAETVPHWSELYTLPSVIRVLQYDDGERALRGADLEFVDWLKRYDGVIEVTQVVKVGTKIAFVKGPLKDMEGKIVKVNKNRKQVEIAIGEGESLMRTIWCSIEYVEDNTDTDSLRAEVKNKADAE